MNSPFASLFLLLRTHVQASAPDIKYVDHDFGQLSQARPPVAWPCLLIDFEDFSFSDFSENVQAATGTLVLRLGFAPYSGTGPTVPHETIEKALSYYDIEWALHKMLQGWQPGNDFGRLNRLSASTQKRKDNYRVREIRYRIAFEDYSTKRSLQYVPAEILVEDQIGT